MSLKVEIQQTLGAFEQDVTLDAAAGTTVLFGRSGAGKTSLINAIAGLSAPCAGRITLNDVTLFDARLGINLPAHQRRIGYVFQDARLFPHLSVARNLDFGAQFAPTRPSALERAALIETLGIGALLDRRPGALSGGEKQRVALGRALLSAPQLLLLDEPLSGLDQTRKEEIMPYLERLRAKGGPPMIYVTHDMSEIVRLADSLVVLRDGTCVASGAAEDVLANPANVKLLGAQEAGALLRGVIEHHAADGLTAVRLSNGVLHVPERTGEIGQVLRIRIRAQDVILSLQKPDGISSQNAIPAQITQIHHDEGSSVEIGLLSGSDRLLARVSKRAATQMRLERGQHIWAILKANAIPATAIAQRENL